MTSNKLGFSGSELSPVSQGELLAAWKKSEPVVRNTLRKAGKGQEVDEVMQDLWVTLERSIIKFDPARGELGAWVGRIARNCAGDLIEVSVKTKKIADKIESRIDRDFRVVVQNAMSDVDERTYVTKTLMNLLPMTSEAMDNIEAYDRTMTLYLEHDGNVRSAATALGITEESLRRCQRETLRTAGVVAKAYEAHQARKKATLRVLLECLPDEEDANTHGTGVWTRHMAVAVARSGGFAKVTPLVLMEVTGWSYNTSRQYLNQTRDLLSIARTIIEYGAPRFTLPEEDNETGEATESQDAPEETEDTP